MMKWRISRWYRRSAAAGLLVVLLELLSGCGGTETGAPSSAVEQREIDYYLTKIEADPEHYPSHAMLAAAYLDKTRETGDLGTLALARKHARRSLEIQPNLEGFKVMARLEGFEHRFERSIEWAQRAADASPESDADGETAAILVDAYLGLGKPGDARRVLEAVSEDGYHKQAAFGNLYKAENSPGEASRAFTKASEFALRENAGKAQAWAEIMAAGVWIDVGEHHKAVPHLEKAARIEPDSKALKVHWAEYYELEGDLETAADTYRSLLKKSDDPELHHRLFSLYKKIGRADESRKEFELAERGFRRIVDAGHIFALGPLAQLLCDAGERPEEASRLSAENLKYKRDAEALATQGCVARMEAGN